MSLDLHPHQDREQRLDEIVGAYLSAVDAGEQPDQEAVLAEHPDLADELREFFTAQDEVQRLATPLRAFGSESDSRRGNPPRESDVLPEIGTLGDFRLLRELGRGGMGVVYEAEQISLSRRVALKVLPFAAALDGRQLQRFRHEAQAAAHLHHQNIVPVYYVGCERGIHFYAMQLIEGHTLAGLIAEMRELEKGHEIRPATGSATLVAMTTDHSIRSPAYFQLVARLGVQAAEALEHAHGEGMIHRDVKPANLMVTARGHLWITDFGLARFQKDVGFTQTGDLIGTLRYMSPEQAAGRHYQVDHRTDVYALGVTLYELITLRSLFEERDREAMMQSIAWEDPRPPRQFNPVVPVELETIVLKAMAKDAEGRYATAQEFADDLRRFLAREPIRARRPSLWERTARWMRRRQTLVAALFAVLLVCVAAMFVVSGVTWHARGQMALAWEQETHHRQRAERHAADEQQARERGTAYLELSLAAQETLYQDLLARFSTRQHMQPADRKLLEELRAFNQNFVALSQGDHKVLRATLLANLRLGNIHRLLGEFTEASEALRTAILLGNQLAGVDVSDVEVQEKLAAAWNMLGNSLAQVGQRQRAKEAQEQSALILEKLVNESSHHPRHLQKAAKARLNLAQLLAEEGDPEARSALEAVIRTWQSLAHATSLDVRQDLARAKAVLAKQLELTDPSHALELYGQVLQSQDELVAESPEQERDFHCFKLAFTQGSMARFLAAMGRVGEAEQLFHAALATVERLAQESPNQVDYRSYLGSLYLNLGTSYVLSGFHTLGRLQYQKGVGILVPVAAASPRLSLDRLKLAHLYLLLAGTHANRGAAEEKVTALAQALRLFKGLAAEFPQDRRHKHEASRVQRLLQQALREREARPMH